MIKCGAVGNNMRDDDALRTISQSTNAYRINLKECTWELWEQHGEHALRMHGRFKEHVWDTQGRYKNNKRKNNVPNIWG